MPRIVESPAKTHAINLLLDGISQRQIARITGLSRPFIRILAKSIGKKFQRNGIDIQGELCMCSNCGSFFRRPHSKVVRSKNQFCDAICKNAFVQGPNHPNWKNGVSASSFSSWVKNQSGYDTWRRDVLERDGYRCCISGKENDLDVHHIMPKAEEFNPEKAFDVSNGMVLNREIHQRIHELIREGFGFDGAIDKLKAEYKKGQE